MKFLSSTDKTFISSIFYHFLRFRSLSSCITQESIISSCITQESTISLFSLSFSSCIAQQSANSLSLCITQQSTHSFSSHNTTINSLSFFAYHTTINSLTFCVYHTTINHTHTQTNITSARTVLYGVQRCINKIKCGTMWTRR